MVFALKIHIKTRIWLLGLLSLGSLLLVLYSQYRMSSETTHGHVEMARRLEQTERLSRLVHELQRERGLSAAHLMERSAAAQVALRSQHTATDARIADLAAAPAIPVAALGGLAAMRDRVAAGEVDARAAFAFYTRTVSSILLEVARQAEAPGTHPMRGDLFAHAALIHAKEYLGQARATLMSAPPAGRIDTAWVAAMGRLVGLFETNIELFQRDANPALRDTTLAALQEPEMVVARRIVAEAMAGRTPAAIGVPRQEWYAAMTAGIDLLREVERYSLIELRAEAARRQAESRRQILLQRAGLLLVSALLAWLAVSSLLALMRALEAALAGARHLGARRERAGLLSASVERDEAGEITQNFTQLLELVDQLNLKASTDALTGALNRHGFAEIAAGELQRAQRYHRGLSLIMLDLDRFKSINDRHGHTVGDQVLRESARLIRDNLRAEDVFARWGGEEFIVLTPESSAEDARRLAEKLGLLLREYRADGLPRFTASFGVASHQPGDDLDSLLARADRALYQAKDGGRDRVVVDRPGDAARPAAANPRGRMALVAGRKRNHDAGGP